MIPYKLFGEMVDREIEYLDNPTLENFKKSTNFQDNLGWPFKANQEQLNYWNSFNHKPCIICPECGGKGEMDSNSFQCHKCKMLWPLSYFQVG